MLGQSLVCPIDPATQLIILKIAGSLYGKAKDYKKVLLFNLCNVHQTYFSPEK